MQKLRLAVQKSGRLLDGSIRLLKDCGISIDNEKNQLKANAKNFPLEIFYLRNSDIPQYLEDGVVDIAIIGENTLVEKQKKTIVVQKLGFSRCRLSLAVPKDVEYEGVSYFEGKNIATSYVNTLSQFLKEENVQAAIHQISGSVEIAPNIGLTEGICDLVSSGSTLFKNNLKEVQVLMKSEACLTKSAQLTEDRTLLLDKLIFRIQAVLKGRQSRYILMNVPNEKIDLITAKLPVLESPTVLPLAKQGWSSVHSVIKKNQFWEVIDELKEAGAKDILIVPIEKMIT
ncbi:ATP phosphoribosyltransferase [Flavobacteriaceae bacterium UJ101]|nr:ATP phosphoribosyltransferase [Flavobacteriaceae bacterium UJ101]